MKRILVSLLAACMLLVLPACGGDAPASSSGATAQQKAVSELDLSLASEETVYHGVHFRAPAIFDWEESGGEADMRSSIPNVEVDFLNDFIECFVVTDIDTILTDDYMAASANIFFAEGDFESRMADDFVMQRTRIGGADALIATRVQSDSTTRQVYLILDSEAVCMNFTNLDPEFDAVFEECIDSIWVEDDSLPQLAKDTEPEALVAAGLNASPWQYDDLYLYVPESFMLVESDSGAPFWFSPDGSSFLYIIDLDPDVVGMDRSQWQALLATQSGFKEMTDFSSGVFNGMHAGQAECLYTGVGDRDMVGYWLAVLPLPYDDKCTVLCFNISEGDTAADELFGEVAKRVRYADGWVGDGLLEVEPMRQSEFGQNAE